MSQTKHKSTKKDISKNIGFYRLRVKKLREDKPVFLNTSYFLEVLNFLSGLDPLAKLYDINTAGRKKFHFLKSITQQSDSWELIFSSAKYEYRPPVIDKTTLSTKNNPRTLTEGDEELTHVKFYVERDHIDFLIEERINGITSKGICDYFNAFKYEYIGYEKAAWESLSAKDKKLSPKPANTFRFVLGFIPNAQFIKTLKNSRSVSAGHIYVEKQLIGSEFMQYSSRLNTFNDDIKLTISSSTQTPDIIEDLYNKMQQGTSKINRIRVEVYDEHGVKSTIDTESFKLKKSIEVERNVLDGVIESKSLFDEMGRLYE